MSPCTDMPAPVCVCAPTAAWNHPAHKPVRPTPATVRRVARSTEPPHRGSPTVVPVWAFFGCFGNSHRRPVRSGLLAPVYRRAEAIGRCLGSVGVRRDSSCRAAAVVAKSSATTPPPTNKSPAGCAFQSAFESVPTRRWRPPTDHTDRKPCSRHKCSHPKHKPSRMFRIWKTK